MKKKLVLVVLFLFPFVVSAHDSEPNPQKVVQALRADEQIKIDGILDEQVWQGTGYSEFVQSDPIDGAQPTEKTTVWVAYDNRSLYVAARLYDSQPESIVSRLGRRDDRVDSDWFEFAVDPYYDRLTGFRFWVNPAASIIDETLYNDSWSDSTWDGVWDWAARVDEQGWAVELRIPYNQLRFPKKEEYIWGVNFRRTIKRKNEKDGFIWIPKEDRGYVSHFARLEGIKGINPGRHIELLPYAVAQAEYTPAEPGNPYATGKNYFGNTGLDLKVGLRSNLTMDAAINPDFGQVEVDPAVINLTAYETFYEEKRPFFIEGSSIFRFGRGGATSYSAISWWEPNFFYSRRIGRTPQGYVSRDGYVNFPDRSTILAAAKISGKILNGWNIGFINALTSREYAEIDSESERFREEVEPFSYYGVLRVQKEFNESNQGFGFITTSVLRDLKPDNLTDILNQNAFSLAFDGWTFLDKNKTWVITGWMGGTRVAGSQADILRLQQAPQHYYQRPDAAHVELDEDATSLSGWAGRIYLNKEKGNFVFNAAVGAISPGFETNDAGFHSRGDIINSHLIFGYQSFHPGKVFRKWWIAHVIHRNYDFGGNKIEESYGLFSQAQFLNYWRVLLDTGYSPPTWNNDLTRGGPLMKYPVYRRGYMSIDSDSRKPVVLSMNSRYSENTAGSFRWSSGVSLRWKPRSNISLSVGPSYSFSHSVFQWVTRVKDPLMVDTYGTRYIFADIDRRTFSTSIRLNWTFTPKLSFQLYTQILLGVGDYERFKELARARSYDFNIFGQEQSTISFADEMYTVDPDGGGPAPSFSFPNPDFNLKSLRGTAVLRWEYLPGSILYFVWTQNRADYAYPGDFNFSRDIGDVFSAPGDNIFLIKISYRWFM